MVAKVKRYIFIDQSSITNHLESTQTFTSHHTSFVHSSPLLLSIISSSDSLPYGDIHPSALTTTYLITILSSCFGVHVINQFTVRNHPPVEHREHIGTGSVSES
jgi:hypothetical protein